MKISTFPTMALFLVVTIASCIHHAVQVVGGGGEFIIRSGDQEQRDLQEAVVFRSSRRSSATRRHCSTTTPVIKGRKAPKGRHCHMRSPPIVHGGAYEQQVQVGFQDDRANTKAPIMEQKKLTYSSIQGTDTRVLAQRLSRTAAYEQTTAPPAGQHYYIKRRGVVSALA
jgi:hypothetical protein